MSAIKSFAKSAPAPFISTNVRVLSLKTLFFILLTFLPQFAFIERAYSRVEYEGGGAAYSLRAA